MLQKYYFYCLLLLVILQSCSSSSTRSVYFVPEETNMLKLAKKNEVKAAITSSNFTKEKNENSSHFNTQIAYSPIKHLGFFGNYLYWNDSFNNNNTTSSGIPNSFNAISNYKLGSGAIGGYYLFQTDNIKLRSDTTNSQPIGFLLDVYAGIGRGRTYNSFSNISNSLLKFNKTYGQIGLHWQDEHVGISLVHRLGQFHFFEGVLNGSDFYGLGFFTYLTNNQNHSFKETAIKVFMGTKGLRGFITITMVKLDSKKIIFGSSSEGFYSSSGLPHVNNTVNAGIVLSVNEIFSFFKKPKISKINF